MNLRFVDDFTTVDLSTGIHSRNSYMYRSVM